MADQAAKHQWVQVWTGWSRTELGRLGRVRECISTNTTEPDRQVCSLMTMPGGVLTQVNLVGRRGIVG